MKTNALANFRPSLGQQYDAVGDRLDAAYAERRQHPIGSPAYVAADAALEAVYADLKALNVKAAAR